MALAAGRLRHRITIRRQTRTAKPKGGFETVWNDVADIWAEVIGLNGREAVIGQALQGISTFRVTIRWRTDLSDADQLRHGALDLNIRSITDPDGRREQLQIIADTGSVQR